MYVRFAATALGLVGLVGATCLSGLQVSGAPLVVKVYGEAGAALAFVEAAEAFAKRQDGRIEVVVASSKGTFRSVADADLLFDDGEAALTEIAAALPVALTPRPAIPLFARPPSIVVRQGNPENIGTMRDLARPGTNIMVVSGAHDWLQASAPTDAADAVLLRAVLDNVVAVARDRKEAEQFWATNAAIDVWLNWGAGKVEQSEIAEISGGLPESLYRAASVMFTDLGESKTLAHSFVAFLASQQGSSIFAKWGWPYTPAE